MRMQGQTKAKYVLWELEEETKRRLTVQEDAPEIQVFSAMLNLQNERFAHNHKLLEKPRTGRKTSGNKREPEKGQESGQK